LFALLCTPARHVEFDGAGMLRGVEGAGGPVGGVGDEFIMHMHQPALGDYRIRNTVIAYEPNRTIGWAPELYPLDGYTDKVGDMQARGHTYTWHLEPAGEGYTRITQVYDWSQVPDEQFRAIFPALTEEQLADSIDRAAGVAG
jgi:hypothetical protein